jgi:hypothetical protein
MRIVGMVLMVLGLTIELSWAQAQFQLPGGISGLSGGVRVNQPPNSKKGGADTAPKTAPVSVEKIRQQAQLIRQYKALLNDPDPTIRASTLDAMVNSDDLVTRELGYEAGFASTDQVMRSIALRSKLMLAKEITIQLGSLQRAKEGYSANRVKGEFLRFRFEGADAKLGVLVKGRDEARVSGLEVTIAWDYDRVTLRLQDGGVLVGTYWDRGNVAYEATSSLQ